MRVTGVQGLLARTVRRAPPRDHVAGEWHEGRGEYAGWYWRGDVSMDQYANGLVPAIGLCRRLFPERARALAVDAASHLLAHDFELTDPDGERTRYGDLSWSSGLGWNSIAQLTGYAIVSLAAELAPERSALPRDARPAARSLPRGRARRHSRTCACSASPATRTI